MRGEFTSCHIKLFDYSHTAAPDYYTEHHHTLIILRPQAENVQLPDLVITSGHYLERYLVGLEEMDTPELLAQLQHYRVYRSPEGPDPQAIVKSLLPFLQAHSGLYIEIQDNAVLIFHPGRDLETEQGVQKLFTLGAEFCAGA